MSLRIGVDMDGTLADLSSAYRALEARLFGSGAAGTKGEDGTELSDKEKLKAAKEASRKREQLWSAISKTDDFWAQLSPIEPDAVRELFKASVQYKWEVFFVTQRPRTAGASVQAQTQRWLIQHGFETPSVLTLSGSRGKAANALELDFLIDDTAKNCVDVVADSQCRPILVVRGADEGAVAAAHRMNIKTVRSVLEAIEFLVQPSPITVGAKNPLSGVLKALGFQR